MKVNIGKYPSRLTSSVFRDYMNNKHGFADWPAQRTGFERGLEWWDDRLQDFYNIFNRLWFDRGQQKVSVRIDPWDTWSMDHTLAEIVVPMLIQLKATKHGAPYVDLGDVPTELWPTTAQQKNYQRNGETDPKHFERWDWVMDEMIFAFESKRSDDWQDQFYSGEHDRITVPVDKDGNEVPEEDAALYEWRKGPNDTFEIDMEGYKAYQDRISNGFKLFGKYYDSLWD